MGKVGAVKKSKKRRISSFEKFLLQNRRFYQNVSLDQNRK